MAKQLRRAAMCPPSYYKVVSKINPWMDPTKPVDLSVAQQQWMGLKRDLEKVGVRVDVVEPQPHLPDMTFACNSGTAWKNKVYLARFRHPERQPEREFFEKWYRDQGFEIYKDDKYFFEGGGDAKFSSPNKLFGGYGFRSDKGAYDLIRKMGDFKVVLCNLKDPRFYHLDTCFLPLDEQNALYFPPAFTPDSIAEMKKEINLIAVDEADALRFVCNGIVVGKTAFLPPGCQSTRTLIEPLGFQVVESPMSEFLKGGGAMQCLLLRCDYAE